MQALSSATALTACTWLARSPKAAPQASAYTPTFFTPEEWRFLHAACDRLIPEDANGPGAVELGVPEFIDRQMATPYAHGALWYMQAPHVAGPANLGYQLPYTPRDIYRRGIAGARKLARQTHNAEFADLDADTRDSVLTVLETGDLQFDDLPASTFFGHLLGNTQEGAFSDPIHGGNKGLGGWAMTGFPGARADFMDWVDQYGRQYPLGSVSISGETI
ncbi:gluconate 2-dehydrogenase subunit 3 family protein [Acetobacter sp. LMG 1636]|uniref:Gluconate 2-dehydrogenase subunit 3 family protein n=1 Tax=Acetobacter fallax TaxID=1737473 RepID=A0ABX0K830_9PROT|nr:gluconate 2-dehydrogenase subunit 3 family protein [Acetobacter fallax]NHO35931.1 gluconate 2-dehydrogenase subunit 3 family protein [Acetobacter fallax]